MHFSGAKFDVDRFLIGARLAPSDVHRAGEKYGSRGKSYIDSGFSIVVSDNETSLSVHEEKLLEFFAVNRDELPRIAECHDIETQVIDFGIVTSDSAAQFYRFSNQLLREVAQFGFEIELSLYSKA